MADGNTETPEYQASFELPDLSNPEPNFAPQKPKTTKQQRRRLPHEQPETAVYQSAFDLTDGPPTPDLQEPIVETNNPETTIQALQEPELNTTRETVPENGQIQQVSEKKVTKKSVDDNPTYCGEGHGIMRRINGVAWCKTCTHGQGSEGFIPKARRERKLLPFE